MPILTEETAADYVRGFYADLSEPPAILVHMCGIGRADDGALMAQIEVEHLCSLRPRDQWDVWVEGSSLYGEF